MEENQRWASSGHSYQKEWQDQQRSAGLCAAMAIYGNGIQSTAGTACCEWQPRNWRSKRKREQKVKLTNKGFQNCGKTRIVQKITLILDDLFGLKIAHFRWQTQGMVTCNGQNTVLFSPPHGCLWNYRRNTYNWCLLSTIHTYIYIYICDIYISCR